MENEGRDDKRTDGDITSRKGVAHLEYKLHRIGTNGRACGGYLPVVAARADDDDDKSSLLD